MIVFKYSSLLIKCNIKDSISSVIGGGVVIVENIPENL